MTSEEIQQTEENKRTVAGWLKEIAYQLALANECEEENKPFSFPAPSPEAIRPGVTRGPGRPPKVRQ